MKNQKRKVTRFTSQQPPKEVKSTPVSQNIEYLAKVRYAIEKKRKDIPSEFKPLFDQIMAGKASVYVAIALHCHECKQWVRGLAEECSEFACMLHPFKKPIAKDYRRQY